MWNGKTFFSRIPYKIQTIISLLPMSFTFITKKQQHFYENGGFFLLKNKINFKTNDNCHFPLNLWMKNLDLNLKTYNKCKWNKQNKEIEWKFYLYRCQKKYFKKPWLQSFYLDLSFLLQKTEKH